MPVCGRSTAKNRSRISLPPRTEPPGPRLRGVGVDLVPPAAPRRSCRFRSREEKGKGGRKRGKTGRGREERGGGGVKKGREEWREKGGLGT